MSRSARAIALSLAQLVILTFLVAGPAHAADQDGSNFAPQPPARVQSTLTLDASRTSGITGEKVRLVAKVKPGFSRPIVLQRKAGDRWVREVAGKTDDAGRWVLKGAVARRTSTYRAVGAAVKRDGKKYTAATSNRVTVKALEQSVAVTLSDSSVLVSERVVATVTAKPVRTGRRLILQKRTGQGWSKVGTERVNRGGKARFLLDTSSPRTDRYRAVATRYRGAVPFHSAARTLEVAAPPDTTAPGVPAGLTATAGDGYVDLDWSDVADPDLAGYRVYLSTTADGPWTLLTSELVTASAYRAEGLANDTEYFFHVTAVDEAGNESAPGAPVTATPTAPAPEPAPEPDPALVG